MVSAIQEVIGRPALLAIANSAYPSMTDALMELIDNPFDYRRGRKLTIELIVNKNRDLIAVTDFGGDGMDDDGLRDWIKWGSGHEHLQTDIGQYHIGGKTALIYLADSVEILCRKAGQESIYRFRDDGWGNRTETYEGDIQTLTPSQLRRFDARLDALPTNVGFTKFVLRRLKKQHRYERSLLIHRLSSVYRNLISNGACDIHVDGEQVGALELPESSTHTDVKVVIPPTKVARNVSLNGSLWVLERDKLPSGRGASIKAGIRTLFNGRLITDGENFTHNLSGRGALQRLIGEVQISGIPPTTNKHEWQRDSEGWAEVEKFLHEKMQPLVNYLNQLGESRRVSRQLRKRTEQIRRELLQTFEFLGKESTGLNGVQGEVHLQGGRVPPTPKDPTPAPTASTRNEGNVVNRTPPPNGAVGRLLRQHGGGIPRIDYEDLGRVQRSQWGDDRSVIVINKSYPLYDEESDFYIAETVLLHLLSEDEVFRNNSMYRIMEELDRILWTWKDLTMNINEA